MATAYQHIEDHKKRIISFAHQRVIELHDEVMKLYNEQKMWEELLVIMNICSACRGHGEIRHVIAQDESRGEKCKGCNGKGYIE